MKLKFVNKTFWNSFTHIFLPVYLLILGLLAYFSIVELRNMQSRYKIIQENLIKENRMVIFNSLNQIISDVSFLSEIPEIKKFYEDEKVNKTKLDVLFSALSRNRKLYHQIRLIDSTGQEKVRVDFRQEQTLIYEDHQLQDKSNRYYFKELSKLGSNEFIITPFDLNIEHGQVEIPFVPVIRFGKIIQDSITKQRLYVIVNYLGNNLLNDLQNTNSLTSSQLFLLDEKGYYLKGPTIEKEWRFVFQDSIYGKFGTDFPEEWEAIEGQVESGHLHSENGFFTFSKFNLCDYFIKQADFANISIPQSCNEWILVSYTDQSEISAVLYTPIYHKYILIGILGGLTLLLITWFISYFRFEQMKERENRLLQFQFMNSLIETIPNPIFFIDHINNQFGCNEAFETLTGKKRTELKDMQIGKLFMNSEKDSATKKLGDNTVKISEMKLKYPDKSIHNLLYYKANILSKNDRIGLVGVFTDITSIRSAEEALRDSEQKLRTANRTKDKFFSIIAHDLKNPFHSIMGLAHLLKANFKDIDDNDRLNIVENIHSATENTYQLLLNLLDWARLQEGKVKLKTEKFKLVAITKESINLMQPKIKEKSLHLSSDIKKNLEVVADKNMVRTIIRNLLSNSIKFTEAGGNIHIAARRLFKYVEISVTDSGIGINEEDQKVLFQVDKRSVAESAETQQGTGLGLVLCKEFIEMNQGKIWAESRVGEGSVFYFTLPVVSL
jgi:PAS domain S-box-containing protein